MRVAVAEERVLRMRARPPPLVPPPEEEEEEDFLEV